MFLMNLPQVILHTLGTLGIKDKDLKSKNRKKKTKTKKKATDTSCILKVTTAILPKCVSSTFNAPSLVRLEMGPQR
jgi:hypothetical protein